MWVRMITDLEVTPLKVRLSHSGLVITALAAFCRVARAGPKRQNRRAGDDPDAPERRKGPRGSGRGSDSQPAHASRPTSATWWSSPRPTSTTAWPRRATRLPRRWRRAMPRRSPPSCALRSTSREPSPRPQRGYKIDSRLIISRDMTKGQVLPSAAGRRGSTTRQARSRRRSRMRAVSFPAEETCHNNVAQGKSQEAVAAARQATQRLSERKHRRCLSRRSLQRAQDAGLGPGRSGARSRE